MNPIIQSLIIQIVTRKDGIPTEKLDSVKKGVWIDMKAQVRSILLIIAGAFSAGFGLKGFLIPNDFIDGGITGISLIISNLSNINLGLLLIIINAPFMVLAFRAVSRTFAIKSIASVILLAALVYFVPFSIVTEDRLLVSVFGGFFLGLGIGLTIRGGAVLDGTEILAVYMTRKTSLTIGDLILILNILIFSVAAFLLSVEIALFAILTYFVASKTVDFVIDGVEEYIGVSIISNSSEEIRLMIIEKLGRGCTVYEGKKGFAKRGDPMIRVDILYSVVTRLELSKLKTEIEKIDSDAFIIMNAIKDAKGGMIKKRALVK